jgi:hypothetical protein
LHSEVFIGKAIIEVRCGDIEIIGKKSAMSKPDISNKCFIHSPAKKKAKTLLLSFGLINKSDSDIVGVRDY